MGLDLRRRLAPVFDFSGVCVAACALDGTLAGSLGCPGRGCSAGCGVLWAIAVVDRALLCLCLRFGFDRFCLAWTGLDLRRRLASAFDFLGV